MPITVQALLIGSQSFNVERLRVWAAALYDKARTDDRLKTTTMPIVPNVKLSLVDYDPITLGQHVDPDLVIFLFDIDTEDRSSLDYVEKVWQDERVKTFCASAGAVLAVGRRRSSEAGVMPMLFLGHSKSVVKPISLEITSNAQDFCDMLIEVVGDLKQIIYEALKKDLARYVQPLSSSMARFFHPNHTWLREVKNVLDRNEINTLDELVHALVEEIKGAAVSRKINGDGELNTIMREFDLPLEDFCAETTFRPGTYAP